MGIPSREDEHFLVRQMQSNSRIKKRHDLEGNFGVVFSARGQR